MTTTQRVQLEPGLIALIGPGFRPQCDHGTCYEAAALGDADGTDCPVDKGYLHVMIGSEAAGGGIYMEGAADEFIAALNARVRHVRNMDAAKITPRLDRGPRS